MDKTPSDLPISPITTSQASVEQLQRWSDQLHALRQRVQEFDFYDLSTPEGDLNAPYFENRLFRDRLHANELLRAAELAVQKAKFPESGTTIELIFDAIICAELAAQSFFSLYVYFMAEEAEFSFEDMRSASSDMAEPQANLKGALEKILDQRSHTSDEEMELREYLEDLLAQVDNVTEDFLGFELFEQFTFAARWCLTRSSPEWLARNAFWVGHLASQAVYILHYMKEVQFDIIQDSMEDLAMSLLSLEARCLLLKLAAHTSSSSDMAEGIRTLREVADHVEDICCAFGTEQYVTTLMVEVREAIQQATMALRRLRNLGLNEA